VDIPQALVAAGVDGRVTPLVGTDGEGSYQGLNLKVRVPTIQARDDRQGQLDVRTGETNRHLPSDCQVRAKQARDDGRDGDQANPGEVTGAYPGG